MVIAILFNSDHPSLGNYYGWTIKQQIFNSGILQNVNRHLKVGDGDLLFVNHAKSILELKEVAEKTFLFSKAKWLRKDKIDRCVCNSTIYAWVIQNVTVELTKQLNESLLDFPSYLGIHEVDFSYPPHLIFYRTYIGEKYRIIGNVIRVLCPMGEFEEYGTEELDELRMLGFENADLEDSGAKLTIFDDFDTIEHYKQIDDFMKQTSSCFKHGENDAYELCMLLSDINPKLFNSLGAAVRATKHIQNEEDVAQVALSGRRYLEQLADVLFEPSDKKFNGHSVQKKDYRNRIWAFIEISIIQNGDDKSKIQRFGKEIDRLIDLVNRAIHSELDKSAIIEAFADLAKISFILLSLQPIYAKNPYYAYEKNINAFFNRCLDDASK